MEKNLHIVPEIEDTVMERPHGFSVNGKRFYLYPVSLGKSMLLSRLVKQLGIDAEIMASQPSVEALRTVTAHKEIACRIIAYATAGDKREIFDTELMEARQSFFIKGLSNEEVAQLILIILQYDKTIIFIRHFGLDKEQKEQAKISKLKNKDSNSIIFGGKSIYGTLIGIACEKFGWTFDYVVWGISLVNLRMMIADCVNSVYLSNDEKKSLKLTTGHEIISMDNPDNWDKIKSMKWD